ncbi:MAG: alcohol dehydrogenase catalytic domain-containing protein, partial [Alphaproteobacteria bacterium]|nr:alcohol dehydrogenase catalytic domain-containing protein [Alphaproteobacteria bacterium]
MAEPNNTRAMQLTSPGSGKVEMIRRPKPEPASDQVLIRVHKCAVCRTDLHVVDGELPEPKEDVIPGHEVIGTVEAVGGDVDRFQPGDRVGVPWLGMTCGDCRFCRNDME